MQEGSARHHSFRHTTDHVGADPLARLGNAELQFLTHTIRL